MGNQGKMERNSKVCVEAQNDEKYSRYAILGFFFQNRRLTFKGLRVQQNKVAENGYSRNYFIN